jgi:anti-sigma factor RsiW
LAGKGISGLGGAIDEREHLVAYLLGEAPAEEQLRLEREYFADDAAYERLLVVEDELAYDYLEGRLSSSRRVRFEGAIGATERGRQNLDFARSLLAALRASRTAAPPPARYWAAGIAAAIALTVLPAWLAFHVASLSKQVETLRAETAASAARLGRELAAVRTAPVEAAFLLTPGLARGGDGPTRLELSDQAEAIRFELVLPPGSTSGDLVITISAATGGQVWSRTAASSGRVVIVQTPTKLLAGGDYEITARRLTAGEQSPDLAAYSFRLIRKHSEPRQ